MVNPILAAEDVAREINALLAEYPQLADDEELFRDTLEGNTRFNEIMDRLLSEMRDNETLAEATAQRIRDAGLPEQLAERLISGT